MVTNQPPTLISGETEARTQVQRPPSPQRKADSAPAGGSCSGAGSSPGGAGALPESPVPPSCAKLLPARRPQDCKSAPLVPESTNTVLCPACAGTEPAGAHGPEGKHTLPGRMPCSVRGRNGVRRETRGLRWEAGETVTRREPGKAVQIDIWPQTGQTSVMQMASLCSCFIKAQESNLCSSRQESKTLGRGLGSNTLFLSLGSNTSSHPVR